MNEKCRKDDETLGKIPLKWEKIDEIFQTIHAKIWLPW